MNIQAETLIVNGIEYIKKDSVKEQHIIGDMRIIVADRGWIFVGKCEDHEDGSVTIHDTKNIRKWGTSKGLGQLVNGPTSNTKFDEYGEVRCTPILQIGVTGGW